jgi:membrane-associated phospholipid phosphatase
MSHFLSVIFSPMMFTFHDLDINILKGIYENRNPLFDSTFIVITNSAAAIAFGIPGMLLIIGLLKKKKELWQKALTIIIPVALSAIVANILKFSLDMPRPYELYPFIEKLSSGGSPSFPSGHTADAFAFAVGAGLVFRKWYIITPCLFWAVLVGTSRMWLGVHFPSDVLAGAIIGTACAFIYYRAEKRIFKRI